MEENEITANDARDRLGQLLDQAHFRGTITVITKFSEPRAVLVPVEWYEERRHIEVTPRRTR